MTSVAFVSTLNGLPWGGSEDLWVQVATRLVEQGHQVSACVRWWPELDPHISALRDIGVTISTWPVPTIPRRALRKFKIDRSGMALPHFDILVINQGGTFDLLGNKRMQVTVNATVRAGKPYVVAMHSNADDYLPHAERQRVAAFYAGSSAVLLPAYRLRWDLERQLAVALPQSVDAPTPTAIGAEASLPWPASTPLRMATVGRLYLAQKGQDLLLAALAKVSWRDEPWALDIYGDGPDEAHLRDLVRFYDLQDRVRFLGFTEDVASVWKSHHVLLMPSRSEARGIVITEAMSCGRPVVASAVGGIPATVTDGVTGILVAAPTVDEWLPSMERLWRDRHLLPAWGENARALAAKMFADDVIDRIASTIVRASEGLPAATRVESPVSSSRS
jgi:hypothetical protein